MSLMANRRKLTPAEAEAARLLLRLWNERKKPLGLTQEKAAAALGYSSQGAVTQYLHGTIALGTDAIIKWAKLLGVHPEDIRPDMKDQFAILGPVIAHCAGEPVEISQDELVWVRMYRQISPEKQRTMKKVMAALAQPEVNEADTA